MIAFNKGGFLMPQLLVRDLSPEVIEQLKKRARRNGRSMQSEVKTIIEKAAQAESMEAANLAASVRRMLSGRDHSDSSELVSEE
jgi:plasmid stability protein